MHSNTCLHDCAVTIGLRSVQLSAANMDWWFVATQAPLPDTTQDFWQMVWEQEVDVIAMLTAFQV